MKIIGKQIDALFGKYGTSCPYELAEKFHVKIRHVDFPKPIYGYYTPILYSEQILINENLPLEQQEKVCVHLMVRHLLHEGIEFCLDEDTFHELEKESDEPTYITLHNKLAYY